MTPLSSHAPPLLGAGGSLEIQPMKLIADALISLPFTLDFCAKGPDVEPLTCALNGMDATLFFTPSLSEGTDGQGIFGEWA